MKQFLLVLVLLLPISRLFATGQTYKIDDIANPDAAEENAFALNQNFNAIAQDKIEKGGLKSQMPRFIIQDLNDPSLAEENAVAIMSNFDDLYNFKVDVSSPSSERRFLLDDIANADKSEENTFIVNQLFNDLNGEKADKP